MSIYFVSSNAYKMNEAQVILKKFDIKAYPYKINEIQSEDTYKIVKDKVLKAYKKLRRPVFVEHTGLYINHFESLPGGLTQIIWDTLKERKFCEYFGNTEDTKAIAKTVIAYCDGKNIYTFEGKVKGNIANEPRGNSEFQWDCAFIPEGYDKTFAELRNANDDISMRKAALEKFGDFLRKQNERIS